MKMKRKAEKELPTMWECIEPVFSKIPNEKIPNHERRWFLSNVYHDTKEQTTVCEPDLKKVKLDKDKLKTRKIGLDPTKEQRMKLDIMLKGAAHAYNLALRLVESGYKSDELQKIVSRKDSSELPEHFRIENDEWFYQKVPTLVKQYALKEFKAAKRSIFSKCKKNKSKGKTNRYSKMKSKDIDNIRTGYLGAQAKHVNFVDDEKRMKLNEKLKERDSLTKKARKKYNYHYLKFYPKFLGSPIKVKLRPKENKFIAQEIKHDVKIYKNAIGKYYLLLPVSLDKLCGKDNLNICGIDPGIRTFVTVFDPCSNKVTKYASKNDYEKNLQKYHIKIDAIQQKRKQLLNKYGFKNKKEIDSKRKMKKYNQLTKIMETCRYRLRNATDNLHRSVANKLIKENKLIVLGNLQIQSIMKKNKLNTKTKRLCYLWSHYRFKQFLQHKALEATHPCYVIVQDESYTTMTCGRCGKRNSNVGSSEIFNCINCGYSTDRDVNGARNILRKYLGHFPK